MLKRTEVILKALIDFIDRNPVQDYTVFYDEAICDGACLQDDARALLEEIQRAGERGAYADA